MRRRIFHTRVCSILRLFATLAIALATFAVIGCGGSDESARTSEPGDTPSVSPTFTLNPVSATTSAPTRTAAPTAPPARPTQTTDPAPTSEPVVQTCRAGQSAPITLGDVPPNIFLGTATLDGVIVPDGTNVTSCIDGEPVATSLVSNGRFLITIQQSIPSLDGREITFSVGGFDAKESTVWSMGGAELIDLSAER